MEHSPKSTLLLTSAAIAELPKPYPAALAQRPCSSCLHGPPACTNSRRVPTSYPNVSSANTPPPTEGHHQSLPTCAQSQAQKGCSTDAPVPHSRLPQQRTLAQSTSRHFSRWRRGSLRRCPHTAHPTAPRLHDRKPLDQSYQICRKAPPKLGTGPNLGQTTIRLYFAPVWATDRILRGRGMLGHHIATIPTDI